MIVPLNFGGGGGSGSDDVTAIASQILQGFTAITHDSNDEPIEGIMIDNGAVSQVLTASTPSIIISQGYHNGQGQVSIAPQEKTVSATTSSQVITPDSDKVLSKVTLKALSQSNLASSNILRGKTITINNGSANVWSVGGSNSNLKMVSGSVNVGSSNSVHIQGSAGKIHTSYYTNINPSITPVYAVNISLGEGSYTDSGQGIFRTGAKSGTFVGYDDSVGRWITVTDNWNSIGNWQSNSVSILGQYNAVAYYWIFGY